MSLSTLKPRAAEPSLNASISSLHAHVRSTYGYAKTIEVKKGKGKIWHYSCRGNCGFACTGYMKVVCGEKYFGLCELKNQDHTGCTDMVLLNLRPTPLPIPSAKSATESSGSAEAQQKKARVNWNLPENQEALTKAIDRVVVGKESQRKVAAETDIPQALLSKIMTGKRSMQTTIGRTT
jgi:hypothetical protein